MRSYIWTDTEGFEQINLRPAILVIPGGGYNHCSYRESEPVGMSYYAKGYNVYILYYSIMEYKIWPLPLEDYVSAMTYIKDHSNETMTDKDKIAVIGFSAGGHLAAAGTLLSEEMPGALILGYPVLNEETTHIYNPTAPGLTDYFRKDICPVFIFHTMTDQSVPVENTLEAIEKFKTYDIPYEAHIYEYGPHGFSTGDRYVNGSPDFTLDPEALHWVDDSIRFLNDILKPFE